MMEEDQQIITSFVAANPMPAQFIRSPKYVGCWVIGGPSGLSFAVEVKPNFVVRFFCKRLLGLHWQDWQPKA